ncbi:MAG: adenosylcobinamide-GDP ribazoletransferase [Verrucomicrobia bacterium]|nr:adenosylcobinamide-GDP ribazoletransferase [Verrucomicrobiota bacterium]
MRSFIAAIQFLTVLPLPARFQSGEEELRRSVVFFPVVGLLIGLAAVALDRGISLLLPPLPASVIVVMSLLAVSGGLHIDGLADTADGFLSARPRERILEIMKDSRTGPMGVMAIVCVVCLKISLLASLSDIPRQSAVFLMPLAGRCALVAGAVALPYARADGGLGAVFGRDRSWFESAWAIAALAVVACALTGVRGLVTTGICAGMIGIVSLWSRQKIGGFTGDTLGATCEITEMAPALVAAACGHGRWLS